jgi:hypothetical protein
MQTIMQAVSFANIDSIVLINNRTVIYLMRHTNKVFSTILLQHNYLLQIKCTISIIFAPLAICNSQSCVFY